MLHVSILLLQLGVTVESSVPSFGLYVDAKILVVEEIVIGFPTEVHIQVGDGYPHHDTCQPHVHHADVLVALQLAFTQPFEPLHVHVHGPLPFTVGIEPSPQRLVVGTVANIPPFDEPHAPSILVPVTQALFTQVYV